MINAKCVSAHVEDLDDGRSVAPGATATIDEQHPHNKALLDNGVLIRVGDVNNDRKDDDE